MFKKLFFFFILFSSVQIYADISQDSKMYVSPEKIQIMTDGIFYVDEQGNFEPVQMVSFDEGGVYVVSFQQCPVCDQWSRDGNLHKPWCPLNKK